MACGVPVIGSSSGEIPEVIGDSGMIVPPGDPRALAAALRRLTPPGARRPLIQAARMRAMQHFSHDVVAQRTMEFWGEILK